MARRINWRWNPTEKQRALFDEWKSNTVNFLVASREGYNERVLLDSLLEYTGEKMPLTEMGIPTLSHFLYSMSECVEVRTLDRKYYIFIRENAVPEGMLHIRELVMEQGDDKGCKTRTGGIRRPNRNQSKYVPIEELVLNAERQMQNNNNGPRSTSSVPYPRRPILVHVVPFAPQKRQPGASGAPINANRSHPRSTGRTEKASWTSSSKNTANFRAQSDQQRHLRRSTTPSTNVANSSYVQSSKPITATSSMKFSALSNEKENTPNARPKPSSTTLSGNDCKIWTQGTNETIATTVASTKTSSVPSSSSTKKSVWGSASPTTFECIIDSDSENPTNAKSVPNWVGNLPFVTQFVHENTPVPQLPCLEITRPTHNVKDKIKTTLDKASDDVQPLVGFTLDTDNVFSQLIHFPVQPTYLVTDRME